jgi:hypothetical protein
MPETYPIIAFFAGPGGLKEGCTGVRDGFRGPFEIALSIKQHPPARAALRLKAFLRQFPNGPPSRTGGAR